MLLWFLLMFGSCQRHVKVEILYWLSLEPGFWQFMSLSVLQQIRVPISPSPPLKRTFVSIFLFVKNCTSKQFELILFFQFGKPKVWAKAELQNAFWPPTRPSRRLIFDIKAYLRIRNGPSPTPHLHTKHTILNPIPQEREEQKSCKCIRPSRRLSFYKMACLKPRI